ncbi:MAG: fused MFS/spermidine synthase [Rubrobacter sp.]|nr:fused MFS/spermidine synthase [Rubrobacter sp.]
MPIGDDTTGRGTTKERRLSGGALKMMLYSTTIFVSAALLFLIEPMFAKFVLPSFGGTPAVWTGSMMFFQVALLASYLYVHATTSWLGARRQAWLQVAVVLLPLALFTLAGPIEVPAEEWAPPAEENPIFWLLGVLVVSVGLPFFAVSATNPLIQRWVSETDHPSASDPYFLYRASNLGSIIGLLGYPLLMEPNLRLANQGVFWTVGYGILVVLVLASAVVLWRSPPPSTATQEADLAASNAAFPTPPVATGGGAPDTAAPLSDALAARLSRSPTLLRRLRWIGLAFVPSSLMLGVTTFITTDITPVPLLWVIPLSLYLFSFMVVFSRNQSVVPGLLNRMMVVALPVTLSLLVVAVVTDLNDPLWLLIPLHLFGFFAAAIVLHGQLARDRPPTRHLTEFYLYVAVGGVLGGVFNALIAPAAFDTVFEYPLAMVMACLFLPRLRRSERRDGEKSSSRTQRRLDLVLPLSLGVVVWGLLSVAGSLTPESEEIWLRLILSLAVGLCLQFAYSNNRPVRFGLGIAALVAAATLRIGAGQDVLYENRSFFGVYSVTGEEANVGLHTLRHGSTTHGAQVLGVIPPEPLTYHHRTGPVGQLFDALPSAGMRSHVAVLGLGAGAMACYAQAGQQMTFYEIDPLVERIARDPSLFTYLRDCPGEYDVVLGDARLSLVDAKDASYNVIVGDVFNSDAIPIHLLTREAVGLYFRKLTRSGVLAMHISNRYMDLEPVLGDLARDRGLECYAQSDTETEGIPHKEASRWVAMAHEEADLGNLPGDGRWHLCASNLNSNDVWTDDFSNLISTFYWR